MLGAGERRTEKRGRGTQQERKPEGHQEGRDRDIGRGPEGQRQGDTAEQTRVRNKEIMGQKEMGQRGRDR